MLGKLFNNWAEFYHMLPLRLVLGILFLYHGNGELFGFGSGGSGLAASAQLMTKWGFQPAAVWAFTFGFIKVIGAIFLILGIWVREVAFCLGIITAIAIWKEYGFNANSLLNIGFEYSVLIIACCLSLMMSGSGKMSVKPS